MLWSASLNGAPSPSQETTPPKAGITKSNDSLGTWTWKEYLRKLQREVFQHTNQAKENKNPPDIGGFGIGRQREKNSNVISFVKFFYRQDQEC